MYRYILFDLDGTLTESGPGIINSIKYTLRHYGEKIPPDEVLLRFVGPPLIDSFEKIMGWPPERAREAVDVYREYFSVTGLFENSVYGGVRELLKRLSDAGRRLGVATSKPQPFCDRILEHFGIDGYFDAVRGIPLDGEDMAKSEVIAKVLEAVGAAPSETLMVGDREHDVIGAKANRIDCVGVLYGYGSREELETAGAKAVFETAEDLGNYILGKD